MKISNELKAEIQEMVKRCQNTISLDELNGHKPVEPEETKVLIPIKG